MVESPLQLLMAEEAADHFAVAPEDRELVILWPGEPLSRRQIGRLADLGDWGSRREAPPRGWSTHLSRSRFVRRLARDGHVEHLFIGDHDSPLMRHLANASDVDRVHVLDDGLCTVTVHQHRSQGDALTVRSDLVQRGRDVISAGLRLKTQDPEVVDYFTVFDLAPVGADTVTANDMPRLRRRVAGAPVDPDFALFLGGAEPEIGAMAEDDFVAVLKAVQEDVGRPLLYAPHRRERATKLARLERELPVWVTDAAGPIEYEIAELDTAPGVIASFFSTALITLPRIMPSDVEVRSYRIPEHLLTKPWRPVVARQYEILDEQSTIPVDVRTVRLHR